jgi:hypothetical protein
MVACRPAFDPAVLDDPRYSRGRDYETGREIIPRVFSFGEYTFIAGYSDTGATLGCYHLDKEMLFWEREDGFFDTIYKANFNNDGIPDFLIRYAFEDHSELSALVSRTRLSFVEKDLGGGPFNCFAGPDTIEKMEAAVILDVNQDGKDEVLINTVRINGRRLPLNCSDTVFVDGRNE